MLISAIDFADGNDYLSENMRTAIAFLRENDLENLPSAAPTSKATRFSPTSWNTTPLTQPRRTWKRTSSITMSNTSFQARKPSTSRI